MIRPRQPRIENPRHLAFVRKLPCLVSGRYGVDAAHIRYGDPHRGKRDVGMAEKPDDRWTVPLYRDEHVRQHNMDERAYWQLVEIDPLEIADALYRYTGDLQAGLRIVNAIMEKARAW